MSHSSLYVWTAVTSLPSSVLLGFSFSTFIWAVSVSHSLSDISADLHANSTKLFSHTGLSLGLYGDLCKVLYCFIAWYSLWTCEAALNTVLPTCIKWLTVSAGWLNKICTGASSHYAVNNILQSSSVHRLPSFWMFWPCAIEEDIHQFRNLQEFGIFFSVTIILPRPSIFIQNIQYWSDSAECEGCHVRLIHICSSIYSKIIII